ncbi:tetratricopeptide repeat protein [Olivibacter sp. XZL3]|uniref:tetratricopeptide repeat protein n=1 Tax=Olivibacter sp. XZL3 TaxID=1735116 RepID=UPI0010648F8A|nr:tetratricopeptide repeat protein [Olivibacter sp. XZL3]
MSNDRLEQLFDFLKTSPDEPFILYAIASEYVKRGDSVNALSYFQALIDKRPDYVGTYYHFGRLYESLGRKDEAIAIYQKGMTVAKQAHDMHAYSELQTVYQSASGIEPDDEDW